MPRWLAYTRATPLYTHCHLSPQLRAALVRETAANFSYVSLSFLLFLRPFLGKRWLGIEGINRTNGTKRGPELPGTHKIIFTAVGDFALERVTFSTSFLALKLLGIIVIVRQFLRVEEVWEWKFVCLFSVGFWSVGEIDFFLQKLGKAERKTWKSVVQSLLSN